MAIPENFVINCLSCSPTCKAFTWVREQQYQERVCWREGAPVMCSLKGSLWAILPFHLACRLWWTSFLVFVLFFPRISELGLTRRVCPRSNSVSLIWPQSIDCHKIDSVPKIPFYLYSWDFESGSKSGHYTIPGTPSLNAEEVPTARWDRRKRDGSHSALHTIY